LPDDKERENDEGRRCQRTDAPAGKLCCQVPAKPHIRSGVRATLGSVVAVLALTAFGLTAFAASGAQRTNDATVRIALDWTPNVDYLGIYVAIDKGFFAKEGIDPKIIPYANTPAETLIKAGKTDLGISYPPDVIINRAEGLEYKAVAGLVAENTTALAVLASSPYTRPAQLNGKLYGGFGIQSDEPIVKAILKADGIVNPVFKQVVLDAGVIDALKSKRVAYTAVFTGIDDVTAALQGVKLRLFPYRTYLGAAGNYPNAVYVASDAAIAKEGPALSRALTALQEGYEWAAKHPAAAEQILIDQNRAALANAKNVVVATGNATAKAFVNSSGAWGYLSRADFAGLEKILAGGGVIKTIPAAADLYTNALLPNG
jgi:ABC-type nitrate/sulfonate/bicarbonate transport system substrate-binding protein